MGISYYCNMEHYLARKKKEWAGQRERREKSDLDIPDDIRTEVLLRDNGRCRVCGDRYHLAPHHIKYRSEGIDHSPENLIMLCGEHHQLVHSNKRIYQPVLKEYVLKLDESLKDALTRAEEEGRKADD